MRVLVNLALMQRVAIGAVKTHVAVAVGEALRRALRVPALLRDGGVVCGREQRRGSLGARRPGEGPSLHVKKSRQV